jgi:hypothetical protein
MTFVPDTTEAIRETLQFVVSSDITSKHKGVLVNALTDALRNAETVHRAEANRPPAAEWQTHEEQVMLEMLRGKTAKSWQHADELVMRVASQLHRSLVDVRKKAASMGVGLAVDYRLVKAQEAARTE